MSANPNDPLRLEILKYLYELHLNHNGTHRHETQGDRLSHALRDRTRATQESIAANLTYLAGKQFVRRRRETFFSPDGRRMEGKHLYSIAGLGIDRIEGGSDFTAQGTTSGVTVNNRDGVATVNLGNGNIVTVEQNNLASILNALAKIIESNSELSDLARRDALADLETVRAQARKARPNKGIVSTAWKGAKVAVTAKGATELLQQAAARLDLP